MNSEERQTFLNHRRVGLELLHELLDLDGFERRVQDLVQTRVPLLAVDEFCHLIHRQIVSAPRTAGDRQEIHKRAYGLQW